MADAVLFREEDRGNLEVARTIVLNRLKGQKDWNHFDDSWRGTGQGAAFVTFANAQLPYHFAELASEIMWELIIQRVITPGLNANNPNLPFFRLTSYGKSVIAAERFIPHDPSGYLAELQAAATTTLTKVSVAYVEEALRCYNSGCHIAAVLLLGVAAESVFIELASVIGKALVNANEKKKFDEFPDQIRPKHRWIVQKYSGLPGSVRKQLPESLDVTLASLGDLIRRQRNDLGHPQTIPPQIKREQAFVMFRLFPTFVADIEAFAAYCGANGL